MRSQFQPLEPRRLMSFTPVGAEQVLGGLNPSGGYATAVAGNGNFIVVSNVIDASNPASVDSSLRAVRYNAAGQQIGDAWTFSAPGIDGSMAVDMDADGDAVITFVRNGDDAYLVRLSKAGVATQPQLLSGNAHFADVSMDDSGGYFVGYFGSVPNLTVQAFDAAGAARAPSFLAAGLGLRGSGSLDVEARPDGSGAVIAFSSAGDNPAESAHFVRVSTTARLGDMQTIARAAGQAGAVATTPDVAVHADGSFVLGYLRYDPTQTSPFRANETGYIQRYDANGVAQGAAAQAGNTAPRLDVLPDGGFVASVEQAGSRKVARYTAAGALDPAGFVTLDAPPVDLWGFATDDAGNTLAVYSREKTATPVTGGTITTYGAPHTRRFTTAELPISLSNGALTILGTAADETITIVTQGANIIATRGQIAETFPASQVQFISVNAFGGNDTITNDTTLPSTMSGGAGDDTLYGGDGPDRLRGEAGRDSVWGRDGNDLLFGDDGVDSLYGNGGSDRIDGGANSDHMRGNGGRDKLFGGRGNDRIYGSESADWLFGGVGNDQLFGDGANDILYGEAGADTLAGLAGDDQLISDRDGLIDQLIGGRGRDTATADINDILTGIEATT